MTVNRTEEKKKREIAHFLVRNDIDHHVSIPVVEYLFQISIMDQSLALYRLKNLTNHNNISVFKDQFKIGRNTSKYSLISDQTCRPRIFICRVSLDRP